MTDSDERPEAWKPVADMDGCAFPGYEVSDKGSGRSVDRVSRGRRYSGKVLSTRRNDDGYVLVDMRCDSTDPEHKRRHTFTMHRVVLTTFDKPCPPGMEACHSERGPAFNWWPEGVRWDTWAANDAERTAALAGKGRAANGRPIPAPKPVRLCILCEEPVTKGGRRCHACVVRLGQEAAALLRAGVSLDEAAARLNYPSVSGLGTLAARYGARQPWAARVAVTLRGVFRRR